MVILATHSMKRRADWQYKEPTKKVTTNTRCISGGRGQKIVFNWVDDADKSKPHTWCPTVKKRIKAHEDKMSSQFRSRKAHAEEFLARPNAARPSASLHMGLGSTGRDAHPHAGAIFCQIEPQEMGTDGHCTVRLQTWARNISPPATSLSPYS